ncbi:hypothetical protein [Burkholderia mayonis]|uniref:hypothetical protein n=1 Tax=Burkholderia mayonis TaxID=1385591 RepID=UPI00131F22F1|nr:hypothetical protein [Burkholderia mayonis]
MRDSSRRAAFRAISAFFRFSSQISSASRVSGLGRQAAETGESRIFPCCIARRRSRCRAALHSSVMFPSLTRIKVRAAQCAMLDRMRRRARFFAAAAAYRNRSARRRR